MKYRPERLNLFLELNLGHEYEMNVLIIASSRSLCAYCYLDTVLARNKSSCEMVLKSLHARRSYLRTRACFAEAYAQSLIAPLT